ncbi:MAG: serine/threonine protein kinase, partial [Myxococcales bacterium]|nr:serine/threonine protein kinase [Myxococcales bacterium]
MKLKPGDRVDRFIVEGVIGAGGTATVYRVRHERLGTRHALKILALQSEKIRERLLVEGQAQATLNHPNIVAVTDILDLDGQPGLLMEYIEGPSLEDALAEYPFTLDDLEALFLGVLDGVEVAHSLGLVHRDLKLANILLAPSPQGFVPKVTDFGLAKVLHNKPGTSATQTGVAMGTPGFMAPEQVRDAGTVDQRADLFSLGCVLYEMISKKRTFPGDEVLQIYIAVTRVDYLPIRTHVPDLPDRYEMAIRGCLQKDLGHRIPDCATLAAVLSGEQP